MKVSVQTDTFDAGEEINALHANDPAIGAVASFVGYCRDEGGRLAALELEHYPGMAEEQLTAIAKEASERWSLNGITVIHRHGRLEPGDPIVLVVAAAPHRRAAFEATDFVMDYLKTQAPFWKKEHPANQAGTASWVEAKASDDDDAQRWER